MTDGASDIEVTLASEAERPLIEGLFQFYTYDWSEMEPAHTAEFEPGADGLFGAYPYMELYWREPARVPLIIRRGGLPVGFALLNNHSHSGAEVDRDMAEFFLMRKHRGGGVGQAALAAIFAAYPGRWEVAIAERNTRARAFWPRAIAGVRGVRGLTASQGDGVGWTGPLLHFTVG